jgi:RNA polymerase II-associated protein 1
MALRGQRFELDLDADEFTPIPFAENPNGPSDSPNLIGEIKERNPSSAPAPPKLKASRTGFPEHRKRTNISALRQQKARQNDILLQSSQQKATPVSQPPISRTQPSDQAIAHQLGRKHGHDFEAQEKAKISEENSRRIAAMSDDDIEEARAELMANLNPALIERLLKRANIDDVNPEQSRLPQHQAPHGHHGYPEATDSQDKHDTQDETPTESEEAEHYPHSNLDHELASGPSIHFPVPPRPASSFVPLDPNSPAFLSDLKTHYFPDTPHDPSSLSWLQDPTTEEEEESPYNPTRDNYSTTQLRFSFKGTIIPPAESLQIPVEKGLHHHGLAPSSAGYTIPELAILSRSTLPNQRCIAYQVMGRILFRLGRGDFGPRGSELQEGLWSVVEKERVIEVIMSEANRNGGHVSAKTYATEALWLWRKGGGGDRGLLKETEKIAK